MEEEDWMISHPKVREIKSHGFSNASQTQCAILAYFDLTEVKLWHTVHIRGSSDLQMVTFIGQKTSEDLPSCILPLPASTELTVERILQCFEALCPQDPCMEPGQSYNVMEQGQTVKAIPRLTLALIDTDSTIVYYNVHNGIQPPTNVAEPKT